MGGQWLDVQGVLGALYNTMLEKKKRGLRIFIGELHATCSLGYHKQLTAIFHLSNKRFSATHLPSEGDAWPVETILRAVGQKIIGETNMC